MYSATVILLFAFSTLLIQNVRSKKIFGGETTAELSDAERNRLINYSLDAFHKESNSLYQHKVVRIGKITTQVVAGVIHRLTLELGETTCTKGSDESDCQLKDPNGSATKCKFTVYERPWENFIQTTVTSCVG